MKGWKKIVHTSSTQKRAGVSILTLEKEDFKSKIFIRDKEALYIFIQMSVYQEDEKTVNIAKT